MNFLLVFNLHDIIKKFKMLSVKVLKKSEIKYFFFEFKLK